MFIYPQSHPDDLRWHQDHRYHSVSWPDPSTSPDHAWWLPFLSLPQKMPCRAPCTRNYCGCPFCNGWRSPGVYTHAPGAVFEAFDATRMDFYCVLQVCIYQCSQKKCARCHKLQAGPGVALVGGLKVLCTSVFDEPNWEAYSNQILR